MQGTASPDLATSGRSPIGDLLQLYSVEVTTKDQKSVRAALDILPRTCEVFVANLPNESSDRLVDACVQLSKGGVIAVPHMVARNTRSREDLDETLARLAGEAGVTRALVLGGDRDHAVGPYDASIQLLQTDLFQKHGIQRVYIGCHPEGHPRVADEVIFPALVEKVAFADKAGFETRLVSQFAFEPEPYLTLARRIRAAGITAPLRVGVAGPAQRTTLIKFALMCGVGASLRALKERQEFAKNVITGETPEGLLREVAAANAADPSLNLDSVHFFTFGSLANSVELADSLRK